MPEKLKGETSDIRIYQISAMHRKIQTKNACNLFSTERTTIQNQGLQSYNFSTFHLFHQRNRAIVKFSEILDLESTKVAVD